MIKVTNPLPQRCQHVSYPLLLRFHLYFLRVCPRFHYSVAGSSDTPPFLPTGASPLKERPSNKAAPAAEERSTNDKKEPQSPVKSQTDAEQVEESFFSKVSSYLPSFRSQSGPSAQSPSKPQPPDMSATGEGEKAGDTKAKVSKDPAEGSRSESGTAGSEDSTDKVDPGTKGEGDSATEASSSQSLVGESGAASVKTARKEAEALAEIPAAGGPNATADTAPLTEVSEAAKVDPESSQADSAPEPPKSTVSESDDSSEIGIQVKGGLYECFLEKRKLSAIFWKAGHRRILRGSWFAQPRKTKDWLPLREDIAEQLEIAYRGQVWRRRSFLPNGMYAHRVNIAGPSLVRHFSQTSWSCESHFEPVSTKIVSSP